MDNKDWINTPDKDGYTPLLNLIANQGPAKDVELLLDAGADPNVQSKDNRTALMIAINSPNPDGWYTPGPRKNKLDNIKLLLKHNIDINKQDDLGKTALMYAADKEYLEVIQLLLEHKANPLLLDKKLRSALHYITDTSIQDEQTRRIIELLLEHSKLYEHERKI